MSEFPEELETILYRLKDEGWTEHSYVFFDGTYEVRMLKENKKITITYE